MAAKPATGKAHRTKVSSGANLPYPATQHAGTRCDSQECPAYLSVSAATPGSVMPARNSSDAPPPVEMWEILSATPADLTAFSESPPPTTDTAPDCATALAMATVPRSKGGFSKTPMGPFHTMVFAPAITLAN